MPKEGLSYKSLNTWAYFSSISEGMKKKGDIRRGEKDNSEETFAPKYESLQ